MISRMKKARTGHSLVMLRTTDANDSNALSSLIQPGVIFIIQDHATYMVK